MRTIIAMALAALVLAGCASNRTAWMKADGSVTTQEQRQLAMTGARPDKIRIDADLLRHAAPMHIRFVQVDVSR